MIQIQIKFQLRSKMQSMIVDLKAAASFLSHATESFVPTITKELRYLPINS
jgi:hypothetical protein